MLKSQVINRDFYQAEYRSQELESEARLTVSVEVDRAGLCVPSVDRVKEMASKSTAAVPG